MEFAPDVEMRKIADLAERFYEKIMDDPPLFISDEASVLDISGDAPEELITKIAAVYGRTLSMNELRQPLWKLIRQLYE